MVFRVCFLDPFQGWVEAEVRPRELEGGEGGDPLRSGARPTRRGSKDYFKEAFEKMGGTITTVQAYTGGDQDFSAQLTTIRQTNPDLLFVPGYYTDAGNVSIQVRKLGITVADAGRRRVGLDAARGDRQGRDRGQLLLESLLVPGGPRPRCKNFVDKYKTDYGQTPDGLAALGLRRRALALRRDEPGRVPRRQDARRGDRGDEGLHGRHRDDLDGRRSATRRSPPWWSR